MRIAYLVAEYPKISETFVQSEIERHRAAGLDVTVVSLFPCSDRRLTTSVPVECLHVHPTPSVRLLLASAAVLRMLGTAPRAAWEAVRFRKYRDLVRRTLVCRLLDRWPGPPDRFDIIHSHFGPMGLLASALRHAGRARAALVTTFHGIDISETVERYGPSYYAPLFAVGDRFLGVSQYWADSLRAMGAPADRIGVQHMGVDCDKLVFQPRGRGGRAHTQLLSIGRLTEKKGHEYSLRALALLRDRSPQLDVRLDIVGGGPLRAELSSLRTQLGLEQRVQLHDSLPHARVVQLLEQADIFVLPSVTARSGDMEGIPVSLMEAMALGLPVVSTRHSGIPELVEHERCGLLVSERNVPELALALEQLVRGPERWESMGRAGRAIVEREFDSARLSEQLRQDYAAVLAQRPPSGWRGRSERRFERGVGEDGRKSPGGPAGAVSRH
jgi:colanic acid/amylovoran biosynthesis glycosyltransferase